MRPGSIFLLLTSAALLPSSPPACAWDDTGHQVIAAIAWSRLDPVAREKIQLLFPEDLHAKNVPIFFRAYETPTDTNPHPHVNYNHVTIANWLDDIRDDALSRPLARWHYLERPFFDGIETRLHLTNSPNVREKIIELLGTVERLRRFDSAPPERAADEKADAAFALAALFHLIGDIHQPLHCISRFSPGFEDGDRNGTLYPINEPRAPNLHYYWDAAGGLFDFAKLGRNYDEAQQKQLEDFTARVFSRWDPARHPEWKNYSVDDWAEEGYKLGREQVYSGVSPRAAPGEDYAEKTRQICAERIGLAGFRMALVFNELLLKP